MFFFSGWFCKSGAPGSQVQWSCRGHLCEAIQFGRKASTLCTLQCLDGRSILDIILFALTSTSNVASVQLHPARSFFKQKQKQNSLRKPKANFLSFSSHWSLTTLNCANVSCQTPSTCDKYGSRQSDFTDMINMIRGSHTLYVYMCMWQSIMMADSLQTRILES